MNANQGMGMFGYMMAMCRGHPECKDCEFDKGVLVEHNGGRLGCITGAERYRNEQRARSESNRSGERDNDKAEK